MDVVKTTRPQSANGVTGAADGARTPGMGRAEGGGGAHGERTGAPARRGFAEVLGARGARGAGGAGGAGGAQAGARGARGHGSGGLGDRAEGGGGAGQTAGTVASYGSGSGRESEGGSGSGSGRESGSGGEEGEREVGRAGDLGGEIDLLDASVRSAAQMAPVVFRLPSEGAAESATRGRSLEELLPALVRRIAWGGDRHKGSVRLELGAGAFAGTTVVVHADGGRVRVELGGIEGPELDRLRARLDARLRGHGLDVESVT